MKPALLFYCQHSVGLGHLMRSYALCEKLAERFRVVLLCGGELPEGIAPPEGVELIPLPPLGVKPGEGFGSGDPRYTTERAWEVRARAHPEHAARRRSRRSCSSSCSRSGARSSPASWSRCSRPRARARRVHRLQPARHPRQHARRPARVRRPRARARRRATSTPCSCTATRASPASRRRSSRRTPLTVPVHYTGFVAGRDAGAGGQRGEHIVVSAGGGRVGAPLMRAAMAALRRPPDARRSPAR